jgi:hypothetical protein
VLDEHHTQETTMITPGIDHIALNVPDLDAQIERLVTTMGLVLEHRFGDFALIADPVTGIRLELGRSEDDDVHLRHFGFRADDVDSAHQHLVDTGMETTEGPHRRDFAGMYTSFLRQQGCTDVQLVKYDLPSLRSDRMPPSTGDAYTSAGK